MEESLEYLQFMENAEEEETWISEKEAMVVLRDSGDTLAATQVSNRLNGLINFLLLNMNLFLSCQCFHL